MNIIEVVILSIIEGLTEFLPISSTGHLILTAKILNIPQTSFVKSLEIFIQLGAIIAVIIIYGSTIWKNKEMILKITTAFLPTALIGLLLYRYIKDVLLGNSLITVAALFSGGIILIVLEKFMKKTSPLIKGVEMISYKSAIMIGVFQSMSVVPGVSRAAATIIGGIMTGLSRKTSVEFSFILAIPTMIAAALFDLYKERFQFNGAEIRLLLIGIILSFIWAIIGIKFLLKFTEKYSLIPFGWYRIIIAVLFFFFFLY